MTPKFCFPETIEATYKITCPMFLGDAEQKATTISPQSFKGALRFWWRAMVWGEIRKKEQRDEEALQTLHHKEAILFGSSAEKDKKIYGQGQVSIKIIQQPLITTRVKNWPPNSSKSPSHYIALGITQSGNRAQGTYQEHREGFPRGKEFTIRLHLNCCDEDSSKLNDALQFLGLFGGLGARSRRAFGSLQLLKLDSPNGKQSFSYQNDEAYRNKASSLLNKYKIVKNCPYSAITTSSNFTLQGGFANAEDAHKELSQKYKEYRGQPSRLRGAKKKVFGLPLQNVDRKSRRASPLFFHIFEDINENFGFSVLHLPSSIFHFSPNHQKVDYNLTQGFLNFL